MGLRVTDTATYRCNVSNPLGTQIRSFDLVVTGRKMSFWLLV